MSDEKYLKLLALNTLRGLTQKDKVDALDMAGFGQTEIANLLGSTSKAISVRLAEVRKARKKGGKQ